MSFRTSTSLREEPEASASVLPPRFRGREAGGPCPHRPWAEPGVRSQRSLGSGSLGLVVPSRPRVPPSPSTRPPVAPLPVTPSLSDRLPVVRRRTVPLKFEA